MEFIGKTVEEAINAGLNAYGITREEAEITVKEEPVKGLFGKLKGQAVVDVAKKAEVEIQKNDVGDTEKEKAFLEKLLSIMEIDATVCQSEDKGNQVLTLVSDDSSSIIGYRGEVLDAMQTLVGAFANIGKKEYKKVVVDCEKYRERREETLIKLAHKLEEKANEIKREVHLEPMNPFERRIIHSALADSTTVKTMSDGIEPNRFVIIVPNNKEEFSKPYNAGANHNRDNRRGGDRRNNRGGYKSNRGGARRSQSGFSEQRKKPTMSFGTYLGNSLKDD